MTPVEMWDYSLKIARSLRGKGRLPSAVEVDDIASAGLLAGIRAAERYDETQGATAKTYIGIRMYGAMLDEIDRHMLHSNVLESYEGMAEIGREPSHNMTPERLAIAHDQFTRLNAAITKLPEERQSFLREYFEEEVTLKTIGQRRGYSEGRACQVFKSIVEKLRGRVGF